ncbi:hypothetical protein [Mesorhizobium sp.]|uniref:hypothetical protein n=1 Tax=Mesorhizobium sp. TaxID=1871066 RepID=UPI0011FCBB86|nr:hypothetical protein [Mesorhizobium sp.]TIL38513.1 MAG: hypothetical protein E5Y82_13505 [Mesorhizobium sp.]
MNFRVGIRVLPDDNGNIPSVRMLLAHFANSYPGATFVVEPGDEQVIVMSDQETNSVEFGSEPA